MSRYEVIGLMSGTSMDGLDIAHCIFELNNGQWTSSIVHCKTVPYNDSWKSKLTSAICLNKAELIKLDESYGQYLGDNVIQFIEQNAVTPDFISSHGHTVIHEPEKRITVQIGSGKVLSEIINLPVVNDFRTINVKSGGQGAPLVPIGDLLLFSDFPICLNLGGIANISEKHEGTVKAYDVAICNLAFNYFASKRNLDYDENGSIGRSGEINQPLFKQLNELHYFSKMKPKSLDASFFEKQMLPLIEASKSSITDQARTCYEHLAFQLASSFNNSSKMLVTGGGAHNGFLMELLSKKYKIEVGHCNNKLIDFKEALIFAFLGVLRTRGEVNCLAEVTGAAKDMCTGELHGF